MLVRSVILLLCTTGVASLRFSPTGNSSTQWRSTVCGVHLGSADPDICAKTQDGYFKCKKTAKDGTVGKKIFWSKNSWTTQECTDKALTWGDLKWPTLSMSNVMTYIAKQLCSKEGYSLYLDWCDDRAAKATEAWWKTDEAKRQPKMQNGQPEWTPAHKATINKLLEEGVKSADKFAWTKQNTGDFCAAEKKAATDKGLTLHDICRTEYLIVCPNPKNSQRKKFGSRRGPDAKKIVKLLRDVIGRADDRKRTRACQNQELPRGSLCPSFDANDDLKKDQLGIPHGEALGQHIAHKKKEKQEIDDLFDEILDYTEVADKQS